MKFILTFDWKPDAKTRNEGISRYLRTGGLPKEGVKLLGRWTNVDLSGGFDLLEGNDYQALSEFALMWNDLMEIKIIPVMEDSELTTVLKTAKPSFDKN